MSKSLELFSSEYSPPSDCQFLGIGIGTATLIGGAVSGGGSLLSGILGSSSATDAAKIQSNAADRAAKLQYDMFQQYQTNLKPWYNTGSNALNMLAGLTGTDIDANGNAIGNPLTAPLTSQRSTIFQGSSVPYSKLVGTGQDGTLGGVQFQPSNIPYGTDGGLGFSPQGVSLSAPNIQAPTLNLPTDQASLAQTPGYQFTRDQGLQSVTNSNTALGLGGTSGALGKGLINYGEGLASTTYNSQYNNALNAYSANLSGYNAQNTNWLNNLTGQYNIYSGNTNQQYGMFSGALGQQYGIWSGQNTFGLNQNQQIYNMLGGLAGSGQNAAVNTGTAGLSAASTAGNQLTSGAAATAGGIIGSTNALTGGFSGAANSIGSGITNSSIYNQLGLGGSYPNLTGGFGGSGGTSPTNYYLGASASGYGAGPDGLGSAGFGSYMQ